MPSLHGAAAGSSKAGHDDLRSSARREIAAVIRITDDRSRVCDVYPLGIGSGWIERHAERALQARCEHPGFPRFGLAVAGTKDADSARVRFGNEKIAIGSDHQRTRVLEIGSEKLRLEAGRHFWQGSRPG